jgi:VWFA-related protein
MTNRFPTLLIFFAVLAVSIGAQQPTQTPPRPAEDDDVVKISTNLIQVDVTVTDSKGRIVRDLRPEEFQVFENGKRQDISNFSFIAATRETPAAAPTPALPGVNLPPRPARPEDVRRAIALVVDDLTLSFESTYYVRRALKKFVDEQMQEGDIVAIIRTAAGIGALQQFTTDKRQLYAAIERVRWSPVGNGNIGAFAPMQSTSPTEDSGDDGAGVRTPEGAQREFEDFRESVFATGTLGAINYVVRGMKELPGRKSIMLLSDGFTLFNTNAEGFQDASRVLDSLRRLVDQANRASVVIYTMDARGLVYTGMTAADDTGGRDAAAIEQELANRRAKLFNTQEGLNYLAKQTGGLAIRNSNDLSGGIRRILDDQSYYLLGYVPDDETFDPRTRRFNRLEVKVSRPGTRVRYRSGFFGVADREVAAGGPTGVTGSRKLLTALTSPFASQQIALRLNSLFGAGGQAGPFIRSLVHVRAQDIKFEDGPEGSKKAIFDIVGIAFGDNGMVADQTSRTYTLTVTKDGLGRLLQNGFVYDFTFPIKKPGAYQLRVAIRDQASDKVGSANQFVDVPNLKKERLVLSGVVLDNVSVPNWQLMQEGKPPAEPSDPLTDTSLRQFKRATVLSYGLSIFNAKPGSAEGGSLTWQMRLFRDGKMIFEGKPQPATAKSAQALQPSLAGSLLLGREMLPGDYVIQITVTDKLAKEKYNTATQFVQFEVIE